MGSEEIGDRSIGSGELGLGVVRGRWWLVRGAVGGVDSQVWGGDNGKQVYSQRVRCMLFSLILTSHTKYSVSL